MGEGAQLDQSWASPPIDWWRLNGFERARTLDDLMPWTSKLVFFYGLTDQVVPPCWYLHDSLLQELLALYQYRDQQQYTAEAPPSAAIDFHYQFALVQVRLRGWVGELGCNTAEHRPTRVSAWCDGRSVEYSRFEEAAETYRLGLAGEGQK